MCAGDALTKEKPFETIRLLGVIEHAICISSLVFICSWLYSWPVGTAYFYFLPAMRFPSLAERFNWDEAEYAYDQSYWKAYTNYHGKLLQRPVSEGFLISISISIAHAKVATSWFLEVIIAATWCTVSIYHAAMTRWITESVAVIFGELPQIQLFEIE